MVKPVWKTQMMTSIPPFLEAGFAECRTAPDPNIFSPEDMRGAEYDLRVRQARAYCRTCVLRRPCLQYAIETGQRGVWGGTTEAERIARGARIYHVG